MASPLPPLFSSGSYTPLAASGGSTSRSSSPVSGSSSSPRSSPRVAELHTSLNIGDVTSSPTSRSRGTLVTSQAGVNMAAIITREIAIAALHITQGVKTTCGGVAETGDVPFQSAGGVRQIVKNVERGEEVIRRLQSVIQSLLEARQPALQTPRLMGSPKSGSSTSRSRAGSSASPRSSGQNNGDLTAIQYEFQKWYAKNSKGARELNLAGIEWTPLMPPGKAVIATGRLDGVGTVLLKQFQSDVGDPQEFDRELRCLMALQKSPHPNMITWYGVEFATRSLVFEYCSFGSIRDLIKSGGLKESICKYIVLYQALLAIQHLHSLGYLFCDIKADNLVMDEWGKVKLIDFGHAKPLKQESIIKGTPLWCPPEVLLSGEGSGGASQSVASDIYSFGMLTYEVATGNLPFPEHRFSATVEDLIIKQERPELPEDAALSAICQRCWAHTPSDRATVEELRNLLEPLSKSAESNLAARVIPNGIWA